MVRVPRYVQWKRDGVVHADRKAKIVTETPVLAVVDGLHGFGQTVAPQAVAIGIDKCKAMGLSMVALRNAGHIGRVGDWAEMAAEAGLVSVHFVNASGSVLVAPFGGTERRLSTAPFCVGVPRPGQAPVVLDFATSVVAEGKVLVASQGGKKLPDNALISLDGKMSADPHVLYGDYTRDRPAPGRQGAGAIRAFGEHKGSGLALICELLGGSLTGMKATGEGRGTFGGNGMLSFYVNPAVVDPEGLFPGTSRATSPTSRAPSRPRPAARCSPPASPRSARASSAWPRAFRCPTTPGPPSSPPPARSASTSAASSKRVPRELSPHPQRLIRGWSGSAAANAGASGP